MKFRFGGATRFTRDLDMARADDASTFRRQLENSLCTGGEFMGVVAVSRSKPSPVGSPPEYVMKPFDVKLSYRGRSFMTVPLEVGHDELGETAEAVLRLAPDLPLPFEALGLEAPSPVPVPAAHHQIVQKLHACTAPGNQRAHDPVDLQLLVEDENEVHPVDLPLTRLTAERLFDSRRAHLWPPTITPQRAWVPLYDVAAEGLPVRPRLDDACAWANDLIRRIDAAERR